MVGECFFAYKVAEVGFKGGPGIDEALDTVIFRGLPRGEAIVFRGIRGIPRGIPRGEQSRGGVVGFKTL
ncbi:hypothetical protein NHQ30_001050 [Ciborinia camelliae]|nr:hypothetical protein NHQ30_001050 [Ciborinia camelliae]